MISYYLPDHNAEDNVKKPRQSRDLVDHNLSMVISNGDVSYFQIYSEICLLRLWSDKSLDILYWISFLNIEQSTPVGHKPNPKWWL